MANSTGKTALGPGRFARRCSAEQYDPADTMEIELLRLWIGLSRLREALHDNRRSTPRKQPAARMSRGTAVRLRRGRPALRRRRRPIPFCE